MRKKKRQAPRTPPPPPPPPKPEEWDTSPIGPARKEILDFAHFQHLTNAMLNQALGIPQPKPPDYPPPGISPELTRMALNYWPPTNVLLDKDQASDRGGSPSVSPSAALSESFSISSSPSISPSPSLYVGSYARPLPTDYSPHRVRPVLENPPVEANLSLGLPAQTRWPRDLLPIYVEEDGLAFFRDGYTAEHLANFFDQLAPAVNWGDWMRNQARILEVRAAAIRLLADAANLGKSG